ncbi:MAG: winged helix-turn-helix domain-containing protein [Candidatus Bathyarchaeia archaeon]
MLKEAYHPNAYLSNIKNIKLGLLARTKILSVLDKGSADAKAIVKETGMRYNVVMHHLRLLEAEGIVERKGSRPHVWTITGFGQKRLVNLG